MKNLKKITAIMSLFLLSCVGMQKDCSSCTASNFGGDWIVVQFKSDGTPFNCWKLENTSVEAERSDSVFWQDSNGHLVHIAGWHNQIQVKNQQWSQAAAAVGVDEKLCKNGVYQTPTPAPSASIKPNSIIIERISN